MIKTIDVSFPKKSPAVLSAMVILIFSCAGDLEPVNHVSAEQMAAMSSSSASEFEASSSSELEVSSSSEQPGSSNSVAQLSSPSETPSSSASEEASSSSVADGKFSSSTKYLPCGDEAYDIESQFCSNDNIYEMCDGDDYVPETHFCWRDKITPLCGGKKHLDEEECTGDKIYAFCGVTRYNVENGLCHKGSVLKTYFTDERDGQRYLSVKIGEQTWMAENLNYAADDSKCVGISGITGTLVDNDGRCATYGRLYNWATAMDSSASSKEVPSGVKGVCPNGWHIPSDAEWDTLTVAVDGTGTRGLTGAGTKLKAASGWSSLSGNGTDDFGFSALPGGIGGSTGGFNYVGNYGYWWSSTEYSATSAYLRSMSYSTGNVSRGYNNKSSLYSVRCLRD